MSRIYTPTDEVCSAALTEAAHRHHNRLLVSLRAGCQMTLRQIDMALGDYMADTQAWMEVITKTVDGENALQKVLAEIIWNEAETAARAELDVRDKARPQIIAEDRAERLAWDRLMAFESAYG